MLCLCAAGLLAIDALPFGLHQTRRLPFGDDLRVVIGERRLLIATATSVEAYPWDSPDAPPAWQAAGILTVPPIVTDGLVIIGSDDGLRAHSELTGHLEWESRLGSLSTPPVARGGWILVVDASTRLRGLRAADGAEIWRTGALGAPLTGPVVVDGTRVFGITQDGRLLAWRITDGALIWQSPTGGTPQHLLAAHGRLFVATADRLTAYRPDGGRRLWSYAIGLPLISRLAADQSHVYVAALDNSVRAHRAANGHLAWSHKFAARIVDGLTVDSGLVLVPHSDGAVHLLTHTLGRAAGVIAAPAAGARGTTVLTTAGEGAHLRLARVTIADTGRILDTFTRQSLPVTAPARLNGTPVPWPSGGRSHRPAPAQADAPPPGSDPAMETRTTTGSSAAPRR